MEGFTSNLIWFIVGAITGLVTNLISPLLYETIRYRYKTWRLKHSTKHPELTIFGSGFLQDRLSVGGSTVNWIVLQYARYVPDRIQCTYDDRKIALLPDFARMKEEALSDKKNRETKGEINLPYNGSMYKLKSFDVGYRKIIDGEEVPVLHLSFGPTDYYSSKVTDLNIGNPIREGYAKGADITHAPISEFASILGINLNIITKDGYLIVAERSRKTASAGGKLHTSVAENLLRPTDAGVKGAPDPFRCAVRGTQEELGLALDIDKIEFTAFGVQPELCQYSLIGYSIIEQTQSEVEEIRSQAIPKDKWENRQLLFVPCNPDAIAKFALQNWDRWFSIGLAAVVLSLFQMNFSPKEINKAFTLYRSNLKM